MQNLAPISLTGSQILFERDWNGNGDTTKETKEIEQNVRKEKWRRLNKNWSNRTEITKQQKTDPISVLFLEFLFWWGCGSNEEPSRKNQCCIIIMNIRSIINSDPKMVADETQTVFRRSILGVGELRSTERYTGFYDWKSYISPRLPTRSCEYILGFVGYDRRAD